MAESPIVELRGVYKVFKRGNNEVRALDGIDLDILAGQYISIMGPSGSGKSTLFNVIGALDRPTGGTVKISELSLDDLSRGQLAAFRGRHLGYVFQMYNLIASMSAIENVALPVMLAGSDARASRQRAGEVLEEVGLGHRLDHRPDELSGGQQQRVAIARALVNRPGIILADEPTANLDFETGQQIVRLLRELCSKHGVTVITATHDHEMLAVSDRVVWIADGKIERIAERDEINVRTGSLHASTKHASE